MTREEARVLLKNLNYQLTAEFDDGGFWVEEGTFEAFEVADAALRGPQPDPEPLDIVQTLRDAGELEEE